MLLRERHSYRKIDKYILSGGYRKFWLQIRILFESHFVLKG
jgi:hypothetical protein